MKRISIPPRHDWKTKVSAQGLVYNTLDDGTPYWNESAHYLFTADEVDMLEAATNRLQDMCLHAAQAVIDDNRFAEFGIPEAAWEIIKWAWNEEPPAIYGRFDVMYDGHTPPKMLEYNADTPTALLEASVVQWYWLQDQFPGGDQFNSIHDRLIAKWRELQNYLTGATLYFAHVDDVSLEDTMTVTYLRETAAQGGIRKTKPILVKDIGWDSIARRFVDLDGTTIVSLFKLYPWEWLMNEEFGSNLIATYQDMQWIEPIWKMLLSNKALLRVLWEMYPNNENLLETHTETPGKMKSFVKKPLLAREGANTMVVVDGQIVHETSGDYGHEGYIFQSYHGAEFDGRRPVIGSWVIDGQSAGIGIRESSSYVTDNLSNFVPHRFEASA